MQKTQSCRIDGAPKAARRIPLQNRGMLPFSQLLTGAKLALDAKGREMATFKLMFSIIDTETYVAASLVLAAVTWVAWRST